MSEKFQYSPELHRNLEVLGKNNSSISPILMKQLKQFERDPKIDTLFKPLDRDLKGFYRLKLKVGSKSLYRAIATMTVENGRKIWHIDYVGLRANDQCYNEYKAKLEEARRLQEKKGGCRTIAKI